MTRNNMDDKAGQLFDFASGHARGFVFKQVHDKFGWERYTFGRAVRRVRRILRSNSDGTLICTPQGMSEPWRYQLTGNWQEAAPWAHNRIGDVESRLETIEDVTVGVLQVTDGRSADGRKAKLVVKVIRRLREDISDIEQAAANGS